MKLEKLSKDLGFGNWKLDKTGTKVISYGTKDILKANWEKMITDSVKVRSQIASNVKKLDVVRPGQNLRDLEKTVKQIFGGNSNVYNLLKN